MILRPAIIFLGAICLAIGVFLFFYGRPLAVFAYAKWHFRKSPEIWIVPKPLANVSVDRPAGPTLAYFGYEFESPSAGVKEVRKPESTVILDFSDCARMVMSEPGPSGDLIRAMQQGASKSGRNIQEVFGEEATRSSFALRSKVLNLTPSDLRLFSSRQEMAGNAVLLVIKGVESQQFKNGLYSFATPWMRGFQEGDLIRDRGVLVEAFDNQDRRLTLIVGAKQDKACFGQPELNRIIFSLRPVAASR
jgi:hypothetical protein